MKYWRYPPAMQRRAASRVAWMIHDGDATGSARMSTPTPDEQHAADRESEFRSYVALAFVALAVAAGIWLLNSFREHNRIIECLEAGHHDCVELDTAARGRSR